MTFFSTFAEIIMELTDHAHLFDWKQAEQDLAAQGAWVSKIDMRSDRAANLVRSLQHKYNFS